MAGRNVDRHVGSTAGVRVPWSAPRRDSRLERGDNLVGEFLVVVASLCGMASEVSHLAAPRNGIVPETASPPSHRGRRGKGAPAGRKRPAKRLDRPNPCRGGRLCEIGLFHSSFMSSALPLFFILNEQASRLASEVEGSREPWRWHLALFERQFKGGGTFLTGSAFDIAYATFYALDDRVAVKQFDGNTPRFPGALEWITRYKLSSRIESPT